jgi:N-acetylglutamate synthase-like GNAT family acetyltransferase
MEQTWRRDEFEISTERARLDFAALHDFLSRHSYWAQGRSRELIERSIEHSLPFGVYRQQRLIGFARVVTDYATFAWLADVYVLEEFRGRGLSKWLMEVIMAHPQLQGLRRWVLATRDAHELYRRFGFTALEQPAAWMERLDPKQRGTLTSSALTADERGAEESHGR